MPIPCNDKYSTLYVGLLMGRVCKIIENFHFEDWHLYSLYFITVEERGHSILFTRQDS